MNIKKSMHPWFSKVKTKPGIVVSILIIVLFIVIYTISLPKKIFNDPSSTVIYSSNNQLLGALIASDGQWRFPETYKVPVKFEKCIVQFEDQHFYIHPGFNPFSLSRALIKNLRHKHVVQGGSTLTMQVIRLSRKGQKRTFFEKNIELILATRAEIRYSKKELLSLFASNAPFGSNVVGLEAAAWRYFGRSADKLSWAESAVLAVLPNAPSLIFPGKNQEKLLIKRNTLLNKLFRKGIIDKNTLILSKLEPLPLKPLALPQIAPHLLLRVFNSEKRSLQVTTTLDYDLQLRVSNIIESHVQKLKYKGIYNAAAIVADVESGNVLAYVGNSIKIEKEDHNNDVDVIIAPRSTGSIIKPILYAAALNDGQILPNTLVPDIPVMIAGYAPKNYNKTYDGAVHAQQALSRSLNIPAVFLLRDYGVDRFYSLLKKLGITTLTFPADHYGLTLILGGAEGNLWDIAGVYSGMARTVNHYSGYSGKYDLNDFKALNYISEKNNFSKNNKISKKGKEPIKKQILLQSRGLLEAAPIWLTFKALLEVNRPEEEAGWEWFLSSKKVAWKTGTSFGFRDGWAIGITSKYVVAVWVGNADGEGRPGLTGVDCAAPLLFDIFDQLPGSHWFQQPYDEMEKIPICQYSGYKASNICSPVDSVWVQIQGLKTPQCIHHQLIHLDKTGKYRVTSDCMSITQMQHQSWFVLPPVQEWYYKAKNPFYKSLPAFSPLCGNQQEQKQMEFIYPKDDAKVLVPIDIDNQKSRIIFEVAHRKPEISIFWHLDGIYIGSTKDIHQMALNPSKGQHLLELVDENGNFISRRFSVK